MLKYRSFFEFRHFDDRIHTKRTKPNSLKYAYFRDIMFCKLTYFHLKFHIPIGMLVLNSWNFGVFFFNFVTFLRPYMPVCLLHSSGLRSSRPEVFCKKGVLRNFTKFTGKHLCQSFFLNKVAASFIKKETLAQVFSCEFCEISKSTFGRLYLILLGDMNRALA